MAIIGILAVLVAKGYGRVQAQAREVAKTSDLRQVGTAVLSFAAEHQGQTPTAGAAIPWGGVDLATGLPSWCEQIESYLDADRKIFSLNHREDPATGQFRPSYFLGGRAAYLAAQEDGMDPLFQPVRLARIESPSRYVLVGRIASGNFGPTDADPENFTQDPAFGYGGGGGTEIFFADGHVASQSGYDPAKVTTTYAGDEESFFAPQFPTP